MRRVFPVLAVIALILWGVALAALVRGRSSRVAHDHAEWAAWFTLAVHGVVIAWSWSTRFRLPAGQPEWILVQARKHRRKGIYLALWSVVSLGLGWWSIRGEEVSNGWPEPALWFGTAWNLGFQPGMFVAEWLLIAAASRLLRAVQLAQGVLATTGAGL